MAEETVTILSDSHIYVGDIETIQSDSHIYGTDTVTIQSGAYVVLANEITTIQSDAAVSGTATIQSDANVVPIELQYRIPKKIQPTMRNANTPPQTGGQGDGGFRIF